VADAKEPDPTGTAPPGGADPTGAGPPSAADDLWGAARARTREEVSGIFSGRARTCANCGHVQTAPGLTCESCGHPFAERRRRWRPSLRQVAAATVALAALGTVLWLTIPGLRSDAADEADRRTARQQALEAAERRRLTADARPHRGEATPGGERAALVTAVERAVTADARARVRAGDIRGPIRGTRCTPYPDVATRRAQESDPAAIRRRYQCLAFTERFALPELEGRRRSGLSGYPFWAVVDDVTGRFVWCKVTPKAGEGGRSLASVPVPEPCRDPARGGGP